MVDGLAAVARVGAVAWAALGLMGCQLGSGAHDPHAGLREGALAPLASEGANYLDPVQADELIAEVSELRELPFDEPVTITEVDDEGLREMVFGLLASPRGKSIFVGDARTMVAFNTASASERLAGDELAPLLSAKLGGYFDPNTRRVYVRRRSADGQGCELQRRATLVHELVHALQHEHFGALEPSGKSEDEWLASRALVEGDARLISLLHVTRLEGYARARLLHMIGSRTGLGEAADESRVDLPEAVRARLSFEYGEGARFVATLVRTGGMKLLDRAFERPPTSTEHVLHPAKYLAGEPAVDLPQPVTPRGHQTVAAGTRGELLIRVMAERCLTTEKARAVAAGWGGDAFTLAAASNGSHVLLWRTQWDTVGDAQEFMQALANRPACWSVESEGGRRLGTAHLAMRRGRQVALARGLDQRLLRPTVAGLLSRPAAAPPRRPLANVVIPPLSKVVARQRGSIHGSAYRSPWLAVTASIPAGWRANIPDPSADNSYPQELVVSDGRNQGWLFVYDRMATAALDRRIVDRLRIDTQAREGLVMSLGSVQAIDTPLGAGRQWIYGGGADDDTKLTIVLVPRCQGTGSMVFTLVSKGARGQRALQQWVASFRPRGTSKRPAPVCTGLNPS